MCSADEVTHTKLHHSHNWLNPTMEVIKTSMK